MKRNSRGIGGLLVRAAALAAFGLAAQGCASLNRGGGITPPEQPVELDAAEAAQHLNVEVKVKAEGDAAEAVAGDLADSVEDALSGAFKLTGKKPDVTVSLGVTAELHAEFGEHRMYKGDVDAAARRAHDNNLLGKRKFSEKGARGLGDSEALKSLARALDEPLTAWVAKTVTADEVGLKAADVTIRWTRFQDLFGIRRRRAEYARTFVAEVGRLKGVVHCELSDEDLSAREQVFRVVYYPEAFRAGLLNALAGIEALKIKR